MNCKKARSLLPLLIGEDLSSKKTKALKKHLQSCPGCQQELRSYDLFLKRVKEWLKKDQVLWNEADWIKAIEKVKEQPEKLKTFPFRPFAPWPFKAVWAYALMAVVTFVLTIFLAKPWLVKKNLELAANQNLSPSEKVEKSPWPAPSQDVISMRMVSKETGLKIIWVFNKNFDLEEKK